MTRTPKEDLEQELKDPEYVKLFGAADAKAEIAITLSRARRAAKKTQKELANAVGRSQPYIARLEGGDTNPSIGTIGSILALLGYRLSAQIVPLLLGQVSTTVQPVKVTQAPIVASQVAPAFSFRRGELLPYPHANEGRPEGRPDSGLFSTDTVRVPVGAA